MRHTQSFLLLRTSLLTAMGLSLGACGGSVTTDEHTTTGATGGAGGSGATGQTSAASGLSIACDSPTPVLSTSGAPTGFEKCADGTIHRAEALPADPTIGAPACAGTEQFLNCKSDAECTAQPHGKCASLMDVGIEGPATSCSCVYACAADADCGAGQVCVAAGVVPSSQPWSSCAPADCVTDKDCPSEECGITSYNNGCYTEVRLGCRSVWNTCRVDADCKDSPNFGAQCVLTGSPEATFQCAGPNCAVGRPLLVDGRAQTARASTRDDWAAIVPGLDLTALDAPTRAALAQHWLDTAALEHASVASFARFTLELLALGAPPALVADAQRAGLDEVEHAKLAYALASAFAAQSFGPGPLDLSGVVIATDRHKVLRALVTEACVGETLGVAEALAIGALTADPALRRAHVRIAEDEQRHAELAWRTLAWLLSTGDDETARFASRCFDEAIAAMQADPSPRTRVSPEHGLLSASALGSIRRQALREVVAPCAAALLGGRSLTPAS